MANNFGKHLLLIVQPRESTESVDVPNAPSFVSVATVRDTTGAFARRYLNGGELNKSVALLVRPDQILAFAVELNDDNKTLQIEKLLSSYTDALMGQ